MSEIDVSKCEFYNNNYCFCYRDDYGDCYHKCIDEELKNCYYKQLQQLEATLDEIKEMCKLSLHCDNCHEILQKIKEVKGGINET